MLTQIRRFQKATLIVVTVIIVIAFAFLYSDFDFMGTVGKQDCAVKVYNRCYRQKEAQKLASHFDVAYQLGMGEFVSVLFGEKRTDNDRTDFIMSLVILRQESERMGIEPTATEIKEAIPTLPIFQQPWVTAAYVQNNILGPNGFSDGDLAQLVKDYLSFQQLRSVIGAGITPIPSETDRRYIEQNQRYTASVIRFDRDTVSSKVEVTDAEISDYFEKNTADLMSESLRGFEFVKFIPNAVAEDATNEVKARADLDFAKAVNRAYSDLADEDADFLEVAKQYEGKKADFTLETGDFKPFAAGSPPEAIKDDAEALQNLFSDALQLDDVTVPFKTADGGYYVFHYGQYIEPKPLTLESATAGIREALTAKKSNRAVNDAASAALAKINEVLTAGKPFAEAAKAAEVKPVALPNFSVAEPPADTEDTSLILGAVEGLGENQISGVIELPGGVGYLLVYVDKIEIYKSDSEDSEKRAIAATVGNLLDRTMFTAWFNQRRAESGSERPFSGDKLE